MNERIDFRSQLLEGDLRTVGNIEIVSKALLAEPHRVPEILNCIRDNNAGVRMRSSDALEKASAKKPSLLNGFSTDLLALASKATQQEVCWHMAQIAPRVIWDDNQIPVIKQTLLEYLTHKSRIVVVSALDALVEMALKNIFDTTEVISILETIDTSSPSIAARQRKLKKRLGI